MPSTGIVVADAARARFITVQPADELSPERGTHLLEHSDLINPEGALTERELFSDRQGRTHGSPSGSAHGADDHRERHQLELTARFARRILAEARALLSAHSLQRLVLAAEPRLLGVLRTQLEHHPLDGASIVTLAEDLSRRSLNDIGEALVHHSLLAPASLARGGVYRPRGQAPSAR